MPALELTLTGQKEMRQKLAALIKHTPTRLGSAMKHEARAILAKSKSDYVPVAAKDGGALRATGKVHIPEIDGDEISVAITYGDDKVDYALAIHEHPSPHDPFTWRGKTVTFTRGGPKYLHRPMQDAVTGMGGRIAKRAIK